MTARRALLCLLCLCASAGSDSLRAAGQAAGTPIAAIACQAPPTATPSPPPEETRTPSPRPTPTPYLDATLPVDPLLDDMAAATVTALTACWNAGEWEAVAALTTPSFLDSALGLPASGAATALAKLNLGPIQIETLGPVAIWSDGRGAVDVVYQRGHGTPRQIVAARWFFIAAQGVARLDEEVLRPPPPLGDQVTIGFGVADDEQAPRWSGITGGRVPRTPLIALHGANRGRERHTFYLMDGSGAVLGLLSLPPWRQGDLLLRDLPPGTYSLVEAGARGSALELNVQ